MKIWLLASALLLCSACTKAQTVEVEGVYQEGDNEAIARITYDGDNIQAIELDEIENGTSKKQMKDEYGMKIASSIGKEWYEQVEYLQKYIQKNGISSITLDAEGKAENEDIKSGCTISIHSLLKAVEDAENKKGQ